MRVKTASLNIRAWLTKAGEGNWKLTLEQKLKELMRTITVLWERSPYCDQAHPISVLSSQTTHSIHLSCIHMALERQAVAEMEICLCWTLNRLHPTHSTTPESSWGRALSVFKELSLPLGGAQPKFGSHKSHTPRRSLLFR